MFQGVELFISNIKKFKEMDTPKRKFLTFQETETLKKLIFWERELFSLPQENILYFRKRKPTKNLYFLKRKLFLYFRKQKHPKDFLCFRKWNFVIFQEALKNFSRPESKKNFLYLYFRR